MKMHALAKQFKHKLVRVYLKDMKERYDVY